MADRQQGLISLPCIPLSIDLGLLGEEAEDQIRARYYLLGVEDRDDLIEALTGGRSVKTHHWDTVQRDESGRWINTAGMGDDAPEEVDDPNLRTIVPETPRETMARQKELWATVPFDYVRSPGEERDNISVGWRYRGHIPSEMRFDEDLNRFLDVRDFGFTEFEIMDEIARWQLPPGVRGNVNVSIDKGGMSIIATINQPGTGEQMAELGVTVSERASEWARGVELGLGSVHKSIQGKDIGTKVLTSLLGFMARHGIETAHLDADITIGRYAWAKQGFDYSGLGRENTVDEYKLRLIDWYEQNVIDGIHGEEAKGEPYRAIEGIETAYDMATFELPSGQTYTGANIDNYDVKSDHVMHAGKAFMLDRDFRGHGEWNGTMDISWMANIKSSPLPFSDENIEGSEETGKAYFLGLAGRDIPEDASDLFFWSDFLESDEVLPIKAIRGERDISHVLRDKHGRWINTPNAGDDAPEKLAGPKDASDFNITDLKHEMAKIMYPRHREFMEHRIAQRALDEQIKIAMPLIDTDDDRKHVNGLVKQAKEHWYAQRNIEADWAEQIHRELDLSAENPIKELKLDHGPLHPGQLPTIQNGLDFVSQYVDESVLGDQVWMYWEKSAPGLTSNFSNGELHLGKSGGISSVIHEVGHWLDSDPAQMQKSIDFLNERVGDEVPVPMNSVKKDEFAPYANTDFTQPDHFSNPYIGFTYQRVGYLGEKLDRYGTEIMSMGLEMLHSRPWELAQDRGFFKHIMGRIQPGRTFPLVSKSAVKAERDISHVWRDEMGRWRDTPQAGDDAPKKPKEKGDETSSPSGDAGSEPTAEKPRSVSDLRSQAKDVMQKGSAELDAAQQEFNQVSSRWIDLIGAGDRKGARALKKEMAKKAEAINQVKMGWVEQIHESIGLTASNPAGPIRAFQKDLSGRTERMLKPALDKLGNAVDKDVWNSMSGRFPKFKRTGDQASYFDTGNGLISLTDSAGESSIWHEMGHWMEANNPDIMSRSQEFLKSRNAGKDPVDYNTLAQSKGRGGHAVFADRQAYDGDFADPYTGLIVNDDEGNMVATEVLSTGLEMLGTKPWRLMEDPEHFNFVMGVIQPGRKYTKAMGGDVWDRVHRDESGQWTDTPGMGDDSPEKLRDEAERQSGGSIGDGASSEADVLDHWSTLDKAGRKGMAPNLEEKAKSIFSSISSTESFRSGDFTGNDDMWDQLRITNSMLNTSGSRKNMMSMGDYANLANPEGGSSGRYMLPNGVAMRLIGSGSISSLTKEEAVNYWLSSNGAIENLGSKAFDKVKAKAFTFQVAKKWYDKVGVDSIKAHGITSEATEAFQRQILDMNPPMLGDLVGTMIVDKAYRRSGISDALRNGYSKHVKATAFGKDFMTAAIVKEALSQIEPGGSFARNAGLFGAIGKFYGEDHISYDVFKKMGMSDGGDARLRDKFAIIENGLKEDIADFVTHNTVDQLTVGRAGSVYLGGLKEAGVDDKAKFASLTEALQDFDTTKLKYAVGGAEGPDFVNPTTGKIHKLTKEHVAAESSIENLIRLPKDSPTGMNVRDHWANQKLSAGKIIGDSVGVGADEGITFMDNWVLGQKHDIPQQTIKAEIGNMFGVGMSDWQKGQLKESIVERERVLAEDSENINRFNLFPFESGDSPNEETRVVAMEKTRTALKSIYDSTQEWFKDAGISEVRLMRGVMLPTEQYDKLRAGESFQVDDNSVASWTIHQSVAEEFASGEWLKGDERGLKGVVLEQMVPAERIFSLPSTGFGRNHWGEVVVVGQKDRPFVRVVQK